jgi:dihydroflavonol-4-reductase
LGHNLIPRLLQAGYRVRALVRPGSDTRFLQATERVELACADDISHYEAVLDACRGCEFVIHAAGHFRFWGDLPTFWQTNVAGTAAVLEAAANSGVSRFIHVSTVAVVGQTSRTQIIDEKHPCRPKDYYQRTKLEGEHLALAYHRTRGLPVLILRPGAFYGPWGRYAFNRLFFEEPLRGWRIKVDGGHHITFPVFAPDVAQTVLLALRQGRTGQIYNICGQPLTHNAVNDVVSDLAGIGRWRFNVPTTAVVALAAIWTRLSRFTRREPFYPINLANYVFQDWPVCSAKAERELNFQPTPFAGGAQATLEWYRKKS